MSKLRQVDVLVSRGKSVAASIRSIDVTEVTYYPWRKEFGDLKADQVRPRRTWRPRTPAAQGSGGPHVGQADPEGSRLGKLLEPTRRRVCIEHVRRHLAGSERRVCVTLGQHRSTQRKTPRGRDDEEAFTADIIELAQQYGRYGYCRITAL